MQLNNKRYNKIIVVHFGSILLYPPTITLIKNLVDEEYRVLVISEQLDSLCELYKDNEKVSFINIASHGGFSLMDRLKRRIQIGKKYKKIFESNYENDDLVWVSGDVTTRALGKTLKDKKYVLHIMELEQYCPLYKGAKILKFPIKEYAKRAVAIVVPEQNRAYIQKIWWGLSKVPYVLPNKPYDLNYGNLNKNAKQIISEMKKEKRKIIIYLGVIDEDRDFAEFAKAVGKMEDDFCMYMFGTANSATAEAYLQKLLNDNPFVKYCGFFPPPMHLSFLKYAYIGLLPYYVNANREYDYQINALYCAPNKIFEYAGFNIPMIGTDVLGLKEPFEKYNIGICCKELTAEAVEKAIKQIDQNHDEMSKRCKEFYDDTDLKQILKRIIESVF